MVLKPLSRIYKTTIGPRASSSARIPIGHFALNATSVCFSPPRLTKTFTLLSLGAGPLSLPNGPSASCLGEPVLSPRVHIWEGPNHFDLHASSLCIRTPPCSPLQPYTISPTFANPQLRSQPQPQSTSYTVAMAASNCTHSFKVIKSDTTLILWNCTMCHSGPHWYIYECSNCKLKTCRPCAAKA
jgi:hypothetical protein